MYCTSTVRVCTGTYALWILWLPRLPVYRCCTCTVLVLSTGTVLLASMCKYSYGVHVWYCGAPPLSVQELLRVDYSKAYLYIQYKYGIRYSVKTTSIRVVSQLVLYEYSRRVPVLSTQYSVLSTYGIQYTCITLYSTRTRTSTVLVLYEYKLSRTRYSYRRVAIEYPPDSIIACFSYCVTRRIFKASTDSR